MSNLAQAMDNLNKKYRQEVVGKGIALPRLDVIPFSSPRANYMTYGGIPRGKLIEFGGADSSGKTTTALDIAGNAQKLFIREWEAEVAELTGKSKLNKTEQARLNYLNERGALSVVFVDCENTLDLDWATQLGVDTDELVVARMLDNTAEEIFDGVLQIIETGDVGLVILDSLGSMMSADEFEKTVEEKTFAGISKALTVFSRKAVNSCGRTGCAFIGINQVREDLSNPYGGLKSPGGKGWSHFCSIKIQFRKGSLLDKDMKEIKRSSPNPWGNVVLMNITKTKVFPPDRIVGSYTLTYFDGIARVADLVDMCLVSGAVVQSGAWYSVVLDDEELLRCQGRSALIEKLGSDPDLVDRLLLSLNCL